MTDTTGTTGETSTGWRTESGLHAGMLVPVFADGQRGNGVVGGDIPADQVAVEGMPIEPAADDEIGRRRAARTWPHLRFRTRPAAEVIGWQIICTCTHPDRPETTWPGPVIARATTPAEQHLELDVAFVTGTSLGTSSLAAADGLEAYADELDSELVEELLDQLRIYAADHEVVTVVEHGEVDSAASALWLWLHAGSADQLEPVRRAAREVRTAEQHLADAVTNARRAGITTSRIHRAILDADLEAGLPSPTGQPDH